MALKIKCLVNSVFSSNTYVLYEDSGSDVWLVDCGDVRPVLSFIDTIALGGASCIKGVLLTHAHFDHLYGLPELMTLASDMVVYTNAFGKMALANERVNMSRYHEQPINIVSDKVRVCDEGTHLTIMDKYDVEAFATPGHNPSCLTFSVGNFLFTGDAYIPGVAVVTTLPHGDKALAQQSERRIQALSVGMTLCPGHTVDDAGGGGGI